MDIKDFKIGDRVETNGHLHSNGCGKYEISIGDVGRVVFVSEDIVSVEFDQFISGHSADGRGKDGHCWNFFLNGCLNDILSLSILKPATPEESRAINSFIAEFY